LLWGGSGCARFALEVAVGEAGYEAIYGPGGARHPASGTPLVATRRPGVELVIAAHKSVAELGVIGRADVMHAIMDAKGDATLRYLDEVTAAAGGRRGSAATATATAGLVYAHTRHAMSRSGDPALLGALKAGFASQLPIGGLVPNRAVCASPVCMAEWSVGPVPLRPMGPRSATHQRGCIELNGWAGRCYNYL
jgi:hypothetical protein